MNSIRRMSVQGIRGRNIIRRFVTINHSFSPEYKRNITRLSTFSRNPSEYSIREKLSIAGELSKFRLSSLVVLTTFAGFSCAGHIPMDWITMTTACVGTGFCAASASTFNQVIEKNRDSMMKRTLSRPLPSGKISVQTASTWGVATGVCGVSMLLAGTNPETAMLGASNIALYAVAYTYSKQYTEMNTWVGSIVGALPPVMGWAAATNGLIIGAEPIALGALLYLWQFPHFFALSWLYREDYREGNFKMISVSDPEGSRLANLIMEYSAYLAAFPILSSSLGLTSFFFAIEGSAANAYLLYLASKFYKDRTNGNAKKLFLCTLWYLPVLLTGFVVHSRMWGDEQQEGKYSNRGNNDSTIVDDRKLERRTATDGVVVGT